MYADLVATLGEAGCGRRVLDVGCGQGEFVGFLEEHGFDAEGVEPSSEAVALACELGRKVLSGTLRPVADAVQAGDTRSYDLIALINVLEHVPNPCSVLKDVRAALSSEGLMCVRVPNDFSLLQEAALAVTGNERWWITAPDHINYFEAASLQSLLRSHGFKIESVYSDFPMELFMLLGDDYVADPSKGPSCHRRRIAFERAVPQHLRREIYARLGSVGIGRNLTILARVDSR